MAQTINTNLMSLNAQRNLATNQASLSTTMQRLSSGLRVNSARDDAAGLAIAERMQAQVRGKNVGVRNANDAVSLAQTAEGALGRISDNLQRMRELAVQSANATNSSEDRDNLDLEYQELASEVERVVENTVFNSSTYLLNTDATLTFQVGANNTSVSSESHICSALMRRSTGPRNVIGWPGVGSTAGLARWNSCVCASTRSNCRRS